MYPNGYLRELNHGFYYSEKLNAKLMLPKEEGDIMITADGYRWRIERTPTVGDLIHPGDYVKTNYGGNGPYSISLVIEVHKYTVCTCPFRTTSGDRYCEESWETPKKPTRKYHQELTEWGLVVVTPGTRQTKHGDFSDHGHGYINELVAVGNRILHLFENNDDEVFVIDPPRKIRRKVKPFQLELL